jgi:hypothetical protein
MAGINAITLPSASNIYMEVNHTYPLVLIPLDNNVWDISLNVYQNGSWDNFPFVWNGSQYNLNIAFTSLGDYPFVVNSTNVSGSIEGIFLVRHIYNVTFRFYKDKIFDLPFFSDIYKNDFSYVTAEFVNDPNSIKKYYDPTLEKYFSKVNMNAKQFTKPVFFAPYRNGKAVMTLYEDTEYAFRLIDGEIAFPSEYSYPNVTKSYGTNVYLGKFATGGVSQEYSIKLTKSDLNPYGTLANWILLILIIGSLVAGGFIFFMVPQHPSIGIMFFVGITFFAVVIRIILLFFGV